MIIVNPYSFYSPPPRSDELYHHGIKGQKWGHMNGPPYPLGASDHSASEKKAGWRSSLKKSSSTDSNQNRQRKGLSDKQKRALKIGAAAVGVALIAGGTAYAVKTGKISFVKDSGRKAVGNAIPELKTPLLSDSLSPTSVFKKLRSSESLSDTLANVNQLRGAPEGANNCTSCAIAGFLRRQYGVDVTSKSTGGKQQLLAGVVESCFKNAKLIEGSATKFGRSPDDAAELLVRRFGVNASGVCGIQWKEDSPYKGGHAFNFEIKDGKVSFMDYQHNRGNDIVRKYWKYIDSNEYFTASRLDNAQIDLDAIKKMIRGN